MEVLGRVRKRRKALTRITVGRLIQHQVCHLPVVGTVTQHHREEGWYSGEGGMTLEHEFGTRCDPLVVDICYNIF